MPDREKVIYSIERCIYHVPDACRDCDYDNHKYNECVEKPVSGWVSVKDRMPEFEGDYLVTDGHSVPWKCRMIKLGESKGFVNSALNPVVKYWMPLPKPPEVNDG